MNITDMAFWTPVILSLKVASVALILAFTFGVLTARLMTKYQFKGKVVLETILMLPLVLPPTVVGFILIIIFGKNSFIGQLIQLVFDHGILFTVYAAIIASTVVAFPLMYQSAKNGFLSIDEHIIEAARVDGNSDMRIFFKIIIPLSKNLLITGAMLSFARALGEFGATLMFAGNIPGKTQTLPTAVYSAIQSGNMTLAWLWVISIITISFVMMLFIRVKEN
ncbi:molybdate ABC transporter permease subunit [Nosocomiicoccus ampullae]|uniref:Molybdenum transport system permease n=1 Tax=Nosocomiicoccus ampullae TaxID=489910 RepID=A0A9Q2CZ26_9STAP|nr:molybdate ABC transporter permease subunit [Nosocomiicoccus ampullae]MBB5175454.1 molybdate transport system permease protein [Nosocomiicoccus ampullae]QYA46865.1 molybdate ABC transporter permease subunit [Nosocomiicoccus ampullae]HJB77940.1 molybdate ABC transporter permease subunit [Candidatus Nosocomiicoccus stercorigallinarum]